MRVSLTIALDCAPGLEPFEAGRQGPHPRLEPIGNEQHHVGHEQRRDLFLISLQLRMGAAQGGLLVGWVLELDHPHGQTI